MSRAAQAVQQAVGDMNVKRSRSTVARGRAPKKTQRARKVVVAGERDPRSGVKEKPKNRVLFINRAPAQALVERLLRAAVASDGSLNADERFEADRLIARIEARADRG